MTGANDDQQTYLGFDFSTQQVSFDFFDFDLFCFVLFDLFWLINFVLS